MATDTRRLRVVVTGDSGGAQQAIEAVGKSAGRADSQVQKWSSRFTMAVGSITKVAGLAAGVAGALFGLSVIQKGIDRLATIEDATVALKVALGSTAKAGKLMNEVLAVVKGTPFNLDQFATAAKNLVVFGVSANKVPKYLHAIGEAAAASGAGAESVGVLVNAFGDAATIGRITGETIQTLASQGVPALKILSNHFGISTQEMQKMISKGAVPAGQGMDILVKGIEKGSKGIAGTTVALGGSMEGLRKTFRGSLGGMQAAMARFGASIVGPFMGDITKGMTGFATAMDGAGAEIKSFLTGVAKSPLWKEIIANATELPAKAGKAIQDFFAGLQGKGQLKGFSGTVNEIGLALRALVRTTREQGVTSDGLVGAMERLAITLRDIESVIREVVGATKDVVRWMQDHETVVKSLTVAVTALVAITKIHNTVLAIQAAGGIMAIIRNTALVISVMKAWAAVTWVVNGAIAAGQWLQIAGYLAAVAVQQKIVAAATKVWAATQWALNAAMAANPLGLIVIAIVAVIAVIALLWNKNENFRKGTIKAWNQLKMVVGVVADFFTKTVFPGIVAAVDWLKEAWNTSWGAIKAVAAAVAQFFMAYLWPTIKRVLDGIGWWVNFLYNAIWKPIWILIQIAAKIVVFWFRDVMFPIYKAVFNGIMAGLSWLWSGWNSNWNLIKGAAQAVASWFTSNILPSLRKAFDQLMAVVRFFKDAWDLQWNRVKAIGSAVATWFNVSIVGSLRKAFDQLKVFLGLLKAGWDDNWAKIKKGTEAATQAMGKAFKWAKDYIGSEWSKLKALAKAPVDFIVNTVYNNGIRKFWNTVADKFGIKTTLSEIKFAEGGVVPGYAPRKDRVHAMVSPGEGIAVPELIKQIGVNRFIDWNKKAREGKPIAFADGGIVGWGKSLLSKGKELIQGFAGPVVKPLLDGLRGIINNGLQGGGIKGLMRGGGNKAVDGMYSWVTGKDKAALDFGAHLGGTAGGKKLTGMGWQMQMFLLRNRFPGLSLISGYRPGAVTLTGNRSYHSMGRAVDVPPRKDVFNWIKGTFGPAIKELIFSPMGGGQVWNGRNHMYREPIRGQHWDHVHWAMDSGGKLPPNSTTVVRNATSDDEYALPERKLRKMVRDAAGNGSVVIEGDVIIQVGSMSDARKLRDELLKLANRNGGKTGLKAA